LCLKLPRIAQDDLGLASIQLDHAGHAHVTAFEPLRLTEPGPILTPDERREDGMRIGRSSRR
jgi:hypothetical protein